MAAACEDPLLVGLRYALSLTRRRGEAVVRALRALRPEAHGRRARELLAERPASRNVEAAWGDLHARGVLLGPLPPGLGGDSASRVLSEERPSAKTVELAACELARAGCAARLDALLRMGFRRTVRAMHDAATSLRPGVMRVLLAHRTGSPQTRQKVLRRLISLRARVRAPQPAREHLRVEVLRELAEAYPAELIRAFSDGALRFHARAPRSAIPAAEDVGASLRGRPDLLDVLARVIARHAAPSDLPLLRPFARFAANAPLFRTRYDMPDRLARLVDWRSVLRKAVDADDARGVYAVAPRLERPPSPDTYSRVMHGCSAGTTRAVMRCFGGARELFDSRLGAVEEGEETKLAWTGPRSFVMAECAAAEACPGPGPGPADPRVARRFAAAVQEVRAADARADAAPERAAGGGRKRPRAAERTALPAPLGVLRAVTSMLGDASHAKAAVRAYVGARDLGRELDERLATAAREAVDAAGGGLGRELELEVATAVREAADVAGGATFAYLGGFIEDAEVEEAVRAGEKAAGTRARYFPQPTEWGTGDAGQCPVAAAPFARVMAMPKFARAVRLLELQGSAPPRPLLRALDGVGNQRLANAVLRVATTRAVARGKPASTLVELCRKRRVLPVACDSLWRGYADAASMQACNAGSVVDSCIVATCMADVMPYLPEPAASAERRRLRLRLLRASRDPLKVLRDATSLAATAPGTPARFFAARGELPPAEGAALLEALAPDPARLSEAGLAHALCVAGGCGRAGPTRALRDELLARVGAREMDVAAAVSRVGRSFVRAASPEVLEVLAPRLGLLLDGRETLRTAALANDAAFMDAVLRSTRLPVDSAVRLAAASGGTACLRMLRRAYGPFAPEAYRAAAKLAAGHAQAEVLAEMLPAALATFAESEEKARRVFWGDVTAVAAAHVPTLRVAQQHRVSGPQRAAFVRSARNAVVLAAVPESAELLAPDMPDDWWKRVAERAAQEGELSVLRAAAMRMSAAEIVGARAALVHVAETVFLAQPELGENDWREFERADSSAHPVAMTKAHERVALARGWWREQ